MIYVLVLVIHVLVAFFLVGVILLQGGRGGLGEALGGSGAQSLFGGGANIVMTKITAVAGSLFMVTCLSLAALSTAKGRSVIDRLPVSVDGLPFALPQAEEDAVPRAPAEPAVPTMAGPAESLSTEPAPEEPVPAEPGPAEPSPAQPAQPATSATPSANSSPTAP